MYKVRIRHSISRAHRNSKGESRGRGRHKRNSNRAVRNLEERNVGTKGKSLKRGLTTQLPEGRESPTID